MKNGLIVFEAAKSVSGAVGSILATYRQGKAIRREQKELLKKRIESYKAVAASRALGEVFKTNIEEIAKAQQLIESMNLSDYAYDMAMEQLRILNNELKRNLEDFSHGI